MILDLSSDPVVIACKAAAGEHWREPDDIEIRLRRVSLMLWIVGENEYLRANRGSETPAWCAHTKDRIRSVVSTEAAPWHLLARSTQ